MNSSQMEWERIEQIEQFFEQEDEQEHNDKHKQMKQEEEEEVPALMSGAPAAREEEKESEKDEVKSSAAAAHKSQKTARVRPPLLRVLAVFVVTILALGVLAFGMAVRKPRARSEALEAVDQLRTRVEALERAAADVQHHHRRRPDNGRGRPPPRRSYSPPESALDLAAADMPAYRTFELEPFVRDPWTSALNVQQALFEYLLQPSIELDPVIISDVARRRRRPSLPASNACSRGSGPAQGATNAQAPKDARFDEVVPSAAASNPPEANPSPPASTTDSQTHEPPVAPPSKTTKETTDEPRFDGGGAPARNVDPRASSEPDPTRDVVRKLRSLSTKQLRAMLHAHGKECRTCVEKDDLVGRVLAVIEKA